MGEVSILQPTWITATLPWVQYAAYLANKNSKLLDNWIPTVLALIEMLVKLIFSVTIYFFIQPVELTLWDLNMYFEHGI